MRDRIAAALGALVLSLSLAAPACRLQPSQPYKNGQAAYDRGDYATALRLWRPLADQGNDSAQFELGTMYREGRGLPQDDAEAVKWFRKAADQWNNSGRSKLGAMYANGRSVPQDYVQAYKWFTLANSFSEVFRIADEMTSAQIAEAKRLAREWKAGQ